MRYSRYLQRRSMAVSSSEENVQMILGRESGRAGVESTEVTNDRATVIISNIIIIIKACAPSTSRL